MLMSHTPENYPKPISGMKHFWLSFLAVVTGVPISLFIVGAVFTLISFFFIMLMMASSGGQSQQTFTYTHAYGDTSASHTLVSVPVRGIILSGSAADPLQSIFGQSYADGEKIKEDLRELAKDDGVDGVILEVDSPGGMITASKAIADGIEYYKKTTQKPIIAHINGMGASGGYWVSSTTDAIYAEQGSEAGSIGVIMGPLVTMKDIVAYGDVATQTPMSFRYFSAGRSKDLGNPFRDITPDEEALINTQLKAEYDKFVAHVSEKRKISAETIVGEIGAVAYGTDDAVRLKLIDGVMSKEEAYDELAQRANIGSDFKVERIENSYSLFGSLFGVRQLLTNIKMSASDKAAARVRFCETNLAGKPLVFDGDITSTCQ